MTTLRIGRFKIEEILCSEDCFMVKGDVVQRMNYSEKTPLQILKSLYTILKTLKPKLRKYEN